MSNVAPFPPLDDLPDTMHQTAASAESVTPESALQSGSLRPGADISVSHVLSETTGLWSAHEQAAHGTRIQLYVFLGAVYEHGAAVAQNELALAELRRNVGQLYATGRWQRTTGNKSARELLLLAAMGMAQPSLRSKYKRVLLEAAKHNVPPDRESFKLWIQQARGVVQIQAGPVQVAHPGDIQSTESSRSLSSDHSLKRDEPVAAYRRDLLTATANSISSIPLIGNSPPEDTFAVVVYRVEANCLVPCLWTDSTADINALLRGVLRRNHREAPAEATTTSHSDPQQDVSIREAA